MKSSLAEIHKQLGIYFYTILNGLDSTVWKNSEQVFYCPVSTFEESVRILQRKDKEVGTNKDIKFPYATITRGGFDLRNDLTRRSFIDKHIDKDNQGSAGLQSFRLQGVKILYDLLVYDKSFDNLEKISELLIFARSENVKHTYTSEIFPADSVETGFHVVYEDLPTPERVPDFEELRRGQGSIYSIRLPFRVDGVVLKSSSSIKKILTALANIKDKEQNSVVYSSNITVTS